MTNGKKTKIVCTIGPATESEAKLTELVEAGMNVMRLNFSHGDFAEHQARVDNIKKVMAKTGKTVAVLQDLSGPKFRIGEFTTERVQLKAGDFITFVTGEKFIGDSKRVWINYAPLAKELKPGNIIMVDDGKKKFEVVSIKGGDIKCRVIIGGDTKGKRGVNLPGAYLKVSSLTAKDKKDIEFGIKNKVDFVAFSFVRTGNDVRELRAILNKAKSKAMIVSKIETEEAVENFDEILELSDAIMVARGDLSVETDAENTPLIQKMIIRKCNALGKPVITATQMLESMIKNPVPTRAEVSDVANAIIDGTDAVMLSEETTLGEFPVEAVKMMTRIAHRVEREIYTNDFMAEYEESHGVTDVVSQSAVQTAHNVGAKLIVAVTESGRTARMLARYRPAERIIALTSNKSDAPKLALSFGCYPIVVSKIANIDDAMKIIRDLALKNDLAKKGDKIVVVAALPFKEVKETNMMVVEMI